jgi:hypothetical protein
MSVSGITAVLAAVSATPAGAGTYGLMMSSSPDRSNPVSLSGRAVSGNIYVFTSPGSGVYRVRFYLDDPNMVGAPRQVETNPPHDFAGGTVSLANLFKTMAVADGSHTTGSDRYVPVQRRRWLLTGDLRIGRPGEGGQT